VIDGKEVYSVRKILGIRLAGSNKMDADKVIAVPSSGISAALGFSEKSGIPYGEGLMKNRFIGRTFIMPTQKQRENGVRMKLSPIVSEINGRRIIVIDDSIVRGTTSRKLVNMLRSIGAKEVHLASSCPPVKYPCFYGIDLASKDELVAANNSVEELQKLMGADSIVYQSLDDLVAAIGIDKSSLCTACLDGNYPTEKAKQRELSSWVKQ
jgi:amidophosphoribosyltransferase